MSNRYTRKLKQIAKAALLKVADPVVTTSFGTYQVRSNFSHEIAWSDPSHERYPLLRRLAEHVQKRRPGESLRFVDVGAHIGACVAHINAHIKEGSYLCVEGNPVFLTHLRHNVRGIPKLSLEEAFLGEHAAETNIFVTTHASTGNITLSDDGPSGFRQPRTDGTAPVSAKLATLDELIERHRFAPHLVKIDCDGYDFKVLRGASQTLAASKPVLVFEWSPIHQMLHRVEKDPSEVWGFLSARGYRDFFLYDPQSLLVFRAGTQEIMALRGIEQYALASITHFDVVCFHQDDAATHDSWVDEEDRRMDGIVERNWGERWRNRLRSEHSAGA